MIPRIFAAIALAAALGGCTEAMQRADPEYLVQISEACRSQASETLSRMHAANRTMTNAETTATYEKLYRDCLTASGYEHS